MPFDGKPDDFGNGGGDGGSPQQRYSFLLACSMMMGSLLTASGYAFQDAWAIDVGKTGALLVMEGVHDGLAVPMSTLQQAGESVQDIMSKATGIPCQIDLLGLNGWKSSDTIN